MICQNSRVGEINGLCDANSCGLAVPLVFSDDFVNLIGTMRCFVLSARVSFASRFEFRKTIFFFIDFGLSASHCHLCNPKTYVRYMSHFKLSCGDTV